MVEQNQNENPAESQTAANNQQDADAPVMMSDAEVQAAQKAIDDRIAEDHANAAFAEEIRREINESMPHISEMLDLDVLRSEYQANKFENCFEVLYERYKHVRRMRRDGNCFYRAFLF